jgi:hypothetical protein
VQLLRSVNKTKNFIAMKSLIFTFFVLFLSSDYVFSQDLKGKRINLQASTSVNGTNFFLETSCSESKIKIKIKVKDSVSMNTLKSDSTYKIVLNCINRLNSDPKNNTLMNYFKKVDSAIKANTVYRIDSVYVTYNQFPKYKKLLNDLFSSSLIKLENRENNKNRIILDGTQMEFMFLQNDSTLFTAHAHSPTKLSHPLLFDYLITTLGIYRKEKLNTSLTKERTSGY